MTTGKRPVAIGASRPAKRAGYQTVVGSGRVEPRLSASVRMPTAKVTEGADT
jgi:hypothetical protein